MGKTKFWEFTSPDSTAARADWAKGENHHRKIVCPENAEHNRACGRISQLSIVLAKLKVSDIVWIWGSDCVVQDHVLELFKKHKLTGFEVKPVKARFKREADGNPPRLWELVVTGWGGMGRPESGVKLIREDKCCKHQQYSGPLKPELFIDEQQWDGSDFFMVWPLPRHIFVGERVKKIVGDHKLKVVRLIPVEKIKPVESAMPGLLRYRFPDERARKIGEPLGIY